MHGYSLVSANNKVREIVDKCIEKKYSEILLITGKGIHSNTDNDVFISKDLSKLRYSIPEYINSNTDLSKNIDLNQPFLIIIPHKNIKKINKESMKLLKELDSNYKKSIYIFN